MNKSAKILFIGDIVGGLGKRTLLELLPQLRERFEPTFVVANAENIAGGFGITPKLAEQLFDGRRRRDHARQPHLPPARDLRLSGRTRPDPAPGQLPAQVQPGHGWCVVSREGVRLGVVSVSGNLFMDVGRPPFAEADAALHAFRGQVDHVLVDMHAEATSEKIGMGWYLDGRVTAVVGTHTHVPTADARVLPAGTAYITDVGMTGPRGGVIGVKREQAIEAMATKMPVRFETSTEDPWLNAVVVSAGPEPMRASGIEQVLLPSTVTAG